MKKRNGLSGRKKRAAASLEQITFLFALRGDTWLMRRITTEEKNFRDEVESWSLAIVLRKKLSLDYFERVL